MIGNTVSHYKILEKLGEGGMGVVYKAEDLKLDRFVALKFLPPSFSFDDQVKTRFTHEARAASALDHSNICNVHEIGETEDGQLFISMALYEGETLKAKISKGPMGIDESITILLQICEGLSKAHQNNIIHRDIKPANIFITNDGVVKILDFGLAKVSGQTQLTLMGSTIGTVAYMSPEQSRGQDVDHRTDIWSLGVVLYEMLTGQLPFKGDYEQAVIYSILNEEPEPITTKRDYIPSELVHVITKALSKDVDNRYQAIEELQSDFKNFGSSENKSQSFGSLKIIKSRYPGWQYFAFGAFILLAAFIFYLTNPFGSDLTPIKSLVVLPFENLTGNNELEYFVDGMHSSLIGDIGKISALRIISKTTSNAYKNVKKSISEIASELNVDAIIESSVLGLGDSVVIQLKLISAFPEEKQLWNQEYIEEKSQILNLYNKVTKEISKEINVILTPQEENLLAESKTVNPEAYDAYMKGQFYLERFGNEDLKKAIEYFQNAIEKAPNWAPPYNGLSSAWGMLMQSSRVEPTVALPKVYEYLNKALELDPNFADLQPHIAQLAVWLEWDWEKGEKAYLKALELNPNDALSRIFYAHFLMIMKRPEEALKQANLALDLDPLRPLLLGLYGEVMIWQGDCQSALIHSQKALSIDPENSLAKGTLAKAYYCLGDTIKWFETWKTIAWWDNKTLAVIDEIFYKQGFHAAVEKIIEVNVEESQNLFISMQGQAWRYLAVGKYDKAMDCLERAYEIHDPNMPYLGMVSIKFGELKKNKRYIALMKKMKLPI